MRFFWSNTYSFFNCFSHFEDVHIIKIINILSHKNRNKQMLVYSIQQHLELKKAVKIVKHVVLFIGKELAEDRRSCHQVPVASVAQLNLLISRNT